MDYFDQNSTLIKHLSDDQDTGVLWYNNSYDTGDQPHHKLGIFYSVKEFDPINITFRSGMDYWAVKPVGEIVWKSLLFLPVVLLSVIGNLLILYVLYRFRQTRSYVNIFIGNMAAADLVSTIFLSWSGIATELFQFYVLGPTYCKFESSAKFTCLLTSTYSLLLLSADRLSKTVFPFKKQLKPTTAAIICVVIWIISLALSSPLAVWREYKVRVWADLTETWCAETVDTSDYWLGMLIILIYVPMILMVLSYGIILRKIRKYEERMNESGNPARGVYRKKIFIMLFVYLITALICWLPIQFTVLYRRFFLERNALELPQWHELAKYISHFMTCLNSAINPIIYGVVNETFRKAITLSFPCCGHILSVASGTRGRSQATLNDVRFAPTSFIAPPGNNICIISTNNSANQMFTDYNRQVSTHSTLSVNNFGMRLDHVLENVHDNNVEELI